MVMAFDQYNQDDTGDFAHTLRAGNISNGLPAVLAFGWQNSQSQGDSVSDAITPSLDKSKTPAVLAFNTKQDGTDADTIAPSLLAMPHHHSHPNGGGQIGVVCTTGDITHALTHEGHDANEDGTGRGTPVVAYFDKQRLGEYGEGGSDSTLAARDYKDATDLVVGINNDSRAAWSEQAAPLRAGERAAPAVLAGIPRRLMPIECERLMSWPDHWTNIPGASDAARYKACGNGVVSNVAQWIGERLSAMHDALPRSA